MSYNIKTADGWVKVAGNAESPIIVSKTGRFKTINSAIEYAKKKCTVDNRVLIIIEPGVYNESVILHPNPGIDLMGYGAVISNVDQAPNAALYTIGTGTFAGIKFVNNVDNDGSMVVPPYAVHVELAGYATGDIKFVDCEFESSVYHALGIGFSPALNVTVENCRFKVRSNAPTSAGFAMHNANTGADSAEQNLYINSCVFDIAASDGSFGCYAFEIGDVTPTKNNKLNLHVNNCKGENARVHYYGADGYKSRIPDTGNIVLKSGSGNDMLALNKDMIAMISQTMFTSDGIIFMMLPYPAKYLDLTRTTASFNNTPVSVFTGFGDVNRIGFTGVPQNVGGELVVNLVYK